MKRPEWKPHDRYSGTDIHDDYEALWAYVEHLESAFGAMAELKVATTLDIMNELDRQPSSEIDRMAADAVRRRLDRAPTAEELNRVAGLIVNSELGEE